MDERIKIVEHKGRKIILADYSNLTIEDILELFPVFTQKVLSTKINLFAMDVTNTHNDKRIKEESQKSITKVRAALGEFHNALIGISGIQKIIANAITRDQYFASSREDAYEWLVKKAAK